METIFMNMESSKTNEPHKLVFDLSQKLDLALSNEYITPQNFYIYYMWKNTRKKCKSNTLKIITSTWNVEFELRDVSYSVSDTKQFLKLLFASIELIID